jgi:type IV pilus assembly protein PilC
MTSSTIPAFSYTARDAAGKLVKGKLDAPSEGAVVARLSGMGLSPVTIRSGGAGTGLQREISLQMLEKRVGLKDLAVMSRQLSTMLASGLSLMGALTVLAGQTDSVALRRSLDQVRTDVETGSSFSDALVRQSDVYPPLMINLVRAGEVGGFLDEAMTSIAATFEKDVELRSTIKSALTYPVVMLVIAVLAVVGMIVFIVPVFRQMFAQFGGDLPLPTQILVTLSESAIWSGPLLVAVIVGAAVWWRRNRRRPEVRAVVEPLFLKLPVFGALFRRVAIARVSRNFAAMLRAGVPILQALSIVGDASGNWVIEQALAKVQDSVRQGRSISAPLAEEPVFPAMVTQMIAVGEDSGSLEQMLEKIADFYDAEVKSTTEQLTSLLEPLMIVVIGSIVGGMIVALYMPIFSIYNEVN